MKKTLFILCFAGIFPLFAGSINVKDYGALGNGKNDDTAAIRKAADHAVKNSKDGFAPKHCIFRQGPIRSTVQSNSKMFL